MGPATCPSELRVTSNFLDYSPVMRLQSSRLYGSEDLGSIYGTASHNDEVLIRIRRGISRSPSKIAELLAVGRKVREWLRYATDGTIVLCLTRRFDMAGDIKNVFIPHVHEDDQTLQALKDLLKGNGYEIRDGSIDSSKPNEAKDENYIKTEILAPRIRWASTVVVLISQETHNSKWVDWEIEYAHKQEKRIIGVWSQGSQDADVPANFELYGDACVGWQADRVMDAIEGRTDDWVGPTGDARPPRNIARYSCSTR